MEYGGPKVGSLERLVLRVLGFEGMDCWQQVGGLFIVGYGALEHEC